MQHPVRVISVGDPTRPQPPLPKSKSRPVLTTTLALLLALTAAGAMAAPPGSPAVALTPAEQAFLRAHPVLTLGTGDTWEPYVIVAGDGGISGYDADILARIKALTGLTVRLLPGDWRARQAQARTREIDGLSTGGIHPERAGYLNFSRPYIRLRKFVLVAKGNPLNIHGRADLDGRVIAIHRGNLSDEKVAASFPRARILSLETVDQVIVAVTTGEADATFDNGALLYRANRIGSPYLQFAFDLNEPLDLVFAVRNDWPEAVSILDKGLAAIGETERSRIQARWFLSPLAMTPDPGPLVLTAEERAFLDQVSPIRLCVDPNWMPFERIGPDGRNQGIITDLLNLVMQRLGKPTELVRTLDWSDSLAAIRDGHCDLVSGAAITPERSEYLDFTRALLSEPLVVVVHEDRTYTGRLEDHAGERFVMVAGHAGIELLRRAHPALRIETVPDVVTAMRLVSRGDAFGYLDLLPTVAWTAREAGILNVKVAGDLPQRYDLAIAVRKGLPLLRSSLSRAVATLPPEQIRGVRDRWLSVRYEQSPGYRRLWPWAGGGLLALFGVLLWNRRLRRLNEALRSANARIERLTLTDELTGLYNRRHFQQVLPQEWHRAVRASRPMNLLVADVDHFKDYNDRYGHPAGDEVLRRLGRLLAHLARRAGDHAFRIGGEEFAMVFAAADQAAAEAFAERLRAMVEELDILHTASNTAVVVTLSVGLLRVCPGVVCDGVPPPAAWEDIYRRADALLYEAKARGRNRVVSEVWCPGEPAAAAESSPQMNANERG